MKLSPEGKSFIKHYEALLLTAKRDGKYFSIGYGHTGPDVTEGMKITKVKAGQLFNQDIILREDAVNEFVKVPLTQSEFDALVSLVYNIGIEAFRTSTLLARLNKGERLPAADHFLKWNRFQGEVSGGLVKRRAAERMLFKGHDIETSIKAGEEAYALYNKRLQGS